MISPSTLPLLHICSHYVYSDAATGIQQARGVCTEETTTDWVTDYDDIPAIPSSESSVHSTLKVCSITMCDTEGH